MSDFASWKPSRRSSVFIRDLTRIKNLEIFILGVVLLLIAFVRFNPRFEYQWDDSSYIIAAKAYLHGQGFVYANDPRMPPAIERPIGVPIITAIVFTLLGLDNIVAVKMLVCGFYLVLCCGLYLWMSRQPAIGRTVAFWVTLAFGSSQLAIDFSHQVMAEIPYTLCSLAALASAIYSAEKADRQGRSWYVAIAGAGVLSVFAIYLRSIGLSVVLAVAFYLALQRAFRQLLVYIPVILALIFSAIMAWGKVVGSPLGGYNYTSQTDGRLQIALQNGLHSSLSLGRLLWPLPCDMLGHIGLHQSMIGQVVFAIITLSALIIILCGLPGLWRVNRLFVFYGVVYMGVLALWPYFDAGRFLVPVLPLFLLCFVFGCKELLLAARKLTARKSPLQSPQQAQQARIAQGFLAAPWAGRLAILPLVLLVLSSIFFHGWQAVLRHDNVFANWQRQGRAVGYGDGLDEFFDAAVWVKHNLPAQLVVASRSHFDFYLWSDHPSIEYGWNGDQTTSIQQALARADVLVVDQYWSQTEQLIQPLVARQPARFRLIHTTGGARPARVYMILKQAQ